MRLCTKACIACVPQSIPVWFTLVGVATPALLLTAVDANRHASGGLLAWYTFFGVVLQVDLQHPCLSYSSSCLDKHSLLMFGQYSSASAVAAQSKA